MVESTEQLLAELESEAPRILNLRSMLAERQARRRDVWVELRGRGVPAAQIGAASGVSGPRVSAAVKTATKD